MIQKVRKRAKVEDKRSYLKLSGLVPYLLLPDPTIAHRNVAPTGNIGSNVVDQEVALIFGVESTQVGSR